MRSFDPNRMGRLRSAAGLAARVVLGAVLLLVIATGVTGCSRAPRVAPLTAEDRELIQQSFDQVWTTVRDKHWDPELGGVNWDSVRIEHQPQLAAATTLPEARAVMRSLINRLGQSHFNIISRDVYDDLQGPEQTNTDGVTGIDLRVIDGHALVTGVDPGSGADEVGVKPGWEILRIGERNVPEGLARVIGELDDKTSAVYTITAPVLGRLRGELGGSLAVRFLTGENRETDLEIPLREARGSRVKFGNLPATNVWIDTLTVGSSIGYTRFNYFLDPMHVNTVFDQALESWMDADGIVIDLRGNPGGIPGMAMGMSGWFFEEKGRRLGTMSTRTTDLKFIVTPRLLTFKGPLAILVDGLSASTSEMLAGGLKDLGRARVFGQRSAGMALPSIIERLPDGDAFQYALANYVSEGGEVLEGNGVAPHVEVLPDRDSLLAGRDPVLEAAITWIRDSD